ncbi:unnamed protein product, partial [Mesorhabditis spiculigera]
MGLCRYRTAALQLKCNLHAGSYYNYWFMRILNLFLGSLLFTSALVTLAACLVILKEHFWPYKRTHSDSSPYIMKMIAFVGLFGCFSTGMSLFAINIREAQILIFVCGFAGMMACAESLVLIMRESNFSGWNDLEEGEGNFRRANVLLRLFVIMVVMINYLIVKSCPYCGSY